MFILLKPLHRLGNTDHSHSNFSQKHIRLVHYGYRDIRSTSKVNRLTEDYKWLMFMDRVSGGFHYSQNRD